MARKLFKRDISQVLAAAEQWIQTCLIADRSVFSMDSLWTSSLVAEVISAFVDHPDFGDDDFMTKLKGQMRGASHPAQRLMAEMLWALLLFPSKMKARTKRQQVHDVWALSGQTLAEKHLLLEDQVLVGIGSGGPGFQQLSA
jgi:5-methylcytosine-specific restriction protein B